MLKNLVIAFFLLIATPVLSADSDKVECSLQLIPVGIYFNQCPRGTLTTGVDAYHPGPSPWPQVRVACVKPKVICGDDREDMYFEYEY